MRSPAELRERLEGLQVLELVERECRRGGINLEVFCAPRRFAQVVAVRHRVWTLLRESSDWSFLFIADVFGVNHTTVVHACQKTAKQREAEFR